jgi:glycosyltransferase involved in cell wall biosynthesis
MDTVLVGGAAHNDFINSLNPDKEIVVIYPSVHPIEKPVKIKKDFVLMVTAWKRGKSPEYIFEIVKAVPELKIKMVGIWIDILYRQEFDKLLDESGFDKQIEIVGEVNETQLSEYFSEARVVLQTNDDRGFGMPALEAAGHGTTFIVPEGQGVCMLFTNNKDGYYTKEKDTKTIVALLKTLIDDKDMAKSMGDKAWRKVVKNYSWENHAIALSKIVEKNNINSA